MENYLKVIEDNRVKTLWDFQTQTDKLVMGNQPDILAEKGC